MSYRDYKCVFFSIADFNALLSGVDKNIINNIAREYNYFLL